LTGYGDYQRLAQAKFAIWPKTGMRPLLAGLDFLAERGGNRHSNEADAGIGAFARVAQLDRVTASEAAGCGFNSRRAHQFRPQQPMLPERNKAKIKGRRQLSAAEQ
jgi:hypothetical protein